MRYFRMLDNLKIPERWFLENVNFETEDDIWKYIGLGEMDSIQKNLQAEWAAGTRPLDLTMGEFELLIANKQAAELFTEQEVQKIPIKIVGKEDCQYYVLVIRKEIDCVDTVNSEFSTWEVGNDIRPDLAGSYEGFTKLVVDPSTLVNINICRIKGFNVAIIVNEVIKEQFERQNFIGVSFQDTNATDETI